MRSMPRYGHIGNGKVRTTTDRMMQGAIRPHGGTMSHSNRRQSASGPIPKELLLGIAADLQGVTQRIAEIKELCEWQLSDLTDAVLAAANVREQLAAQDGAAAVEPGFLALVEEMSALHARLESQVGVGHEVSRQFLEIARAVERELALVKAEAEARARQAAAERARDAMAGRANIVFLQAQRDARSGTETIHQRGKELCRSLRLLQDAVGKLFLTQAQSGGEVSSLRRRMQDYQRHLQRRHD